MLSGENIDRVFNMFDKNGDGFIDLEELRTIFLSQKDEAQEEESPHEQ